MSVKVLPVTPLLSGVFVHRVFCAYFVTFEGAGVMLRFLWCTQEDISLTCNGVAWRFSTSLTKIYAYGAQKWNVNWIHKSDGENKYLESLKRRVMVFDSNLFFAVGYQVSFVSNILLTWYYIQH